MLLCLTPIRLPVIRKTADTTRTTPMPPVWIRSRMTACPKGDQAVQVSRTTSPVTQTAEVAVNRASVGGHATRSADENGSISSSVPSAMITANPKMIICDGESFRCLNIRFLPIWFRPPVSSVSRIRLFLRSHPGLCSALRLCSFPGLCSALGSAHPRDSALLWVPPRACAPLWLFIP